MTNSIDTNALNDLGLAGRSAPSNRGELGQDDFLELMITQLRNQDPFKPMESGQFLGQIAQFGTVSGIEEVRSALESLATAMSANRTLQAANLVGRDALVSASEAWLPPQGSIRGAIATPPGATSATIEVYDLNGSLVDSRAVSLTGHAAGTFEWDGTLPDGTTAPSGYYQLRARGEVDGAPAALDVLVSGRVESVSVADQGQSVELTLTGLGVVNLNDVRRVS